MRALVAGGAMIDTIAIIADTAIERMSLLNAGNSFLLLEEGRKTEAIEISTHCGGGAINVAISLARLGVEASVLVKLGQDQRADQILARLDDEGVSHRFATQDGRDPTGASVLVSSHDRNAAVFTFRGANTRLCVADLDDEAFDTDVVYVANLSNHAAHCFPSIVEKGKARQAMVAANPGIRQLNGHRDSFKETLGQLDILTLNRREADAVIAMLGSSSSSGADKLSFPDALRPPPLAFSGLHSDGHTVSLRAFFGALIELGVGYIVVTDGSEGAFAASGGRLFYCPAHTVAVAGTAGAGDAFASTFTAYAAGGRATDEALLAASINAASVLGHVDTQTGLMSRAMLDAVLSGKKSTPNVISWTL